MTYDEDKIDEFFLVKIKLKTYNMFFTRKNILSPFMVTDRGPFFWGTLAGLHQNIIIRRR